MTEAPSTRAGPAMSPQRRRRATLAILATVALMFVGGMVAYLVAFRNDTVCPGGKPWISRTDQGLGRISYDCGNGLTVTQGLLP